MSQELKPCPFCGGPARNLPMKIGFWSARAICDSCNVSIDPRTWNCRATVPAAQQAGWALVNMDGKIVYQHENRDNVEMNQPYIKTPTRILGVFVGAAPSAPAEAPNFCPRCGKRPAADSVHTCTPPAEAAGVRDALEQTALYFERNGGHWLGSEVAAAIRAPLRALQGKPEAASAPSTLDIEREADIRIAVERKRAHLDFEARVERLVCLIRAGHKFDWPYTDAFDDGGYAYHEAKRRIKADAPTNSQEEE